jgi:hypothetical protein
MRPELFPQEHTELLDRVAWGKRRGYLGLVTGAMLLFAVAAEIMAIRHCRDPADRPDIVTMASAIGTALDASVVAGRARADQLAADTKVRAGILTDVETVADMVRSEFSFKPLEGETIELFQLNGKNRLTLMRLPADAPGITPVQGNATKLVSPGAGTLNVVVEAKVIPYSDGSGEDRGALALSTKVNLAHLRARLAELASDAVLKTGDSEFVLRRESETGGVPEGVPISVAVPTSEGSRLPPMILSVVLHAAGGRQWWAGVAYASCGLGALLLLGFMFAFRRARVAKTSPMSSALPVKSVTPMMMSVTPEMDVPPKPTPPTNTTSPRKRSMTPVRLPPKTMQIPPKRKSG